MKAMHASFVPASPTFVTGGKLKVFQNLKTFQRFEDLNKRDQIIVFFFGFNNACLATAVATPVLGPGSVRGEGKARKASAFMFSKFWNRNIRKYKSAKIQKETIITHQEISHNTAPLTEVGWIIIVYHPSIQFCYFFSQIFGRFSVKWRDIVEIG